MAVAKETKYYWSINKRLYMGGYEPEVWRNAKQLEHGDRAIRFFNHLFSTDERRKQKFIEESKSFKDGTVIQITKDTFEQLHGSPAIGNKPVPFVTEVAVSVQPQPVESSPAEATN